MKLWIDDVRPAPEGYKWVKSVIEAKIAIENANNNVNGAEETIRSFECNYDKLTDYSKERYNRYTYPEMKKRIEENEIELIDIDHDAGDYAIFGGDYIRLLDWLEETGRNYPIRIHSMNPVGVANMRAIIQKNGWKEIR